MGSWLKGILLEVYGRLLVSGLIKPPGGVFARCFKAILSSLKCDAALLAMEFQSLHKPFCEGKEFMGYLDSASQLPKGDGTYYEIGGWLFHKSTGMSSLTICDEAGGSHIADYGFARPDLASIYPHIKHAALSGFRFLAPIKDSAAPQKYSFKAAFAHGHEILSGSFEPVVPQMLVS